MDNRVKHLCPSLVSGPAYQLMVDQLERFQLAVSRWSAARYRLLRAGDLTQVYCSVTMPGSSIVRVYQQFGFAKQGLIMYQPQLVSKSEN